MGTHGGSEGDGIEPCRGQIEATQRAGLAVAGDGCLDHAEHGQARQPGLVRVAPVGQQPVDSVADRMAANLDAAMVGIGGQVLGVGWVQRVGEPGGHLCVVGRPVALQREQPVAATLFDQSSGLALAMQRVAGDQGAVEVEQAKQGTGGDDLAFFVPGGDLTDHHPCVGGKRGHHMQGRPLGRPVERAPQRLAVERDDARAGLAEGIEEAREAAGEGRRIEQPEQPRERVVARQAAGQGQELPKQPLPVTPEIREIDAAFRPTNRRRQGNRQQIQQVMPLRVARPRVRKRRKARPDRQHPRLSSNSGKATRIPHAASALPPFL